MIAQQEDKRAREDPRWSLLPVLTKENRAFFDGCSAGELRLQRCRNCASFRYPDSPRCPSCFSADFEWQASSGRGEVLSWIVMHQPYFPEFADRMPYLVIWVRLEDGPIMMTGLMGDARGLEIGAKVRVTFDRVGDRAIPSFLIVR